MIGVKQCLLNAQESTSQYRPSSIKPCIEVDATTKIDPNYSYTAQQKYRVLAPADNQDTCSDIHPDSTNDKYNEITNGLAFVSVFQL